MNNDSPKEQPRKPSDRRQGAPSAPLFGELLVEAGWEPETIEAPEQEGWIRAAGLVPERRAAERRS